MGKHERSLANLVAWAEKALMDGKFETKHFGEIRDVVARLGVADVRAFGLTWEDSEPLLKQLGGFRPCPYRSIIMPRRLNGAGELARNECGIARLDPISFVGVQHYHMPQKEPGLKDYPGTSMDDVIRSMANSRPRRTVVISSERRRRQIQQAGRGRRPSWLSDFADG